MDGGAGNDTIDARLGEDLTLGGTTRMNGGTGDDWLIGRRGEADEFVFTHGGDFGTDVIRSFDAAHDRILIDTFQDDPVGFTSTIVGTSVHIEFEGDAGLLSIEGGASTWSDSYIEFI